MAEENSTLAGGRHLTLVSIGEERMRKARISRYALITLRVLADGILLGAAFVLAYWLRYGLELGSDVAPESYRPLSAFSWYIVAFVAVTLLTLQMRGLYALPRGATWLDHMRLITIGSVIGVSALTLGALLVNPVLPSRMLFIYLGVCSLVVFGIERTAYRSLRMWLWRRGINIPTSSSGGSRPGRPAHHEGYC